VRHIRKKTRWLILVLLFLSIISLALFPIAETVPVQFVDRESGSIKTEKVAGEKWLVWLYNNPVGEATLWALAKRKAVSSFYGELMDRPASAEKIGPFVEEFNIDMSEAKKQNFNSFNDFFTRELKASARTIDTVSTVAVSPADGKILAYADISTANFIVKGYRFDVPSFLSDEKLAKKYSDGSLVIIRLAPNDYHRFHFPVNGKITSTEEVYGDYYSVNPIALREMVEIFCLNKRAYSVIDSPVFGQVVMAEVGATMVGSIVQTFSDDTVLKGAEKGYFKFGGSTVVLLFEKDKIILDEDLLENTLKGLETSVLMGERIGIAF
jgi:phosphatidylserine decarboxylase